ncbi:MAG: rhomboid family intramembrane serine protease [Candidatus Verstraetearchaeota archaeon]|nr:rhomboid family intramembrane serine protease [Candidatus Verstraetearchaeota archaeon]
MFPVKDIVERRSFPYITVALICINTMVFIISLFDFEGTIYTYGFIPADASLLTAFTCMFLHAGIDHIFGNMWFLLIFGDNVEDRFGHMRFLLFYLATGFVATYVNYLVDPSSKIPTVGASGAISGVMGAYIVLFPYAKVHTLLGYYLTTLPAFVMLGFWFLLQLFFGTSSLFGGDGSGIAYWAHIGGFVAGALVSGLYRVSVRR